MRGRIREGGKVKREMIGQDLAMTMKVGQLREGTLKGRLKKKQGTSTQKKMWI